MFKVTDNIALKCERYDIGRGRDNGDGRLFRQLDKYPNNVNQLSDDTVDTCIVEYINPIYHNYSPGTQRYYERIERVRGRVTDIKSFDHKFEMSEVPDVVKAAQNIDCIDDDEEFFLSKNSTLFSQVSSNTLTAMEYPCIQSNQLRVVEVREIEIIKEIAGSGERVVLPKANVHFGQKPLVVERVEILEDTETEPESVDTDPEDKDSKVQGSSRSLLQKELVPILKRKSIGNATSSSAKKLTLRLHQEEVISEASVNSGSGEGDNSWKDEQSVAEYLILDEDGGPSSSKEGNARKMLGSKGMIHKPRDVAEAIGTADTDNNEDRVRKSIALRRLKALSLDDTTEDCESFYGSDKETDDALIFSDDTEIEASSDSSDGDTSSVRGNESFLNKVNFIDVGVFDI